MQVPIRLFKGLYTNVDKTDIPENYFPEYKNIRTRPGFIESRGLALQSIPIQLPSDEQIITEQYVYIDDDKHKNKLIANKLVNNYTQKFTKHIFRITYKIDKYLFYLITDNVSELVGEHIAEKGDYLPKIIEEEGILKILMKEMTYTLAKIDRKFRGVDERVSGYKFTKLVDTDINYEFSANLTTGEATEIRECYFVFKGYEEIPYIEPPPDPPLPDRILFDVFTIEAQYIERVIIESDFGSGILNLYPPFTVKYTPLDGSWSDIQTINDLTTRRFSVAHALGNTFGFEGKNLFQLLYTVVTDTEDEYILTTRTIQPETPNPNIKWNIEGKVKLKEGFNPRIIGMRIYIRFDYNADFEQAKTILFISGIDTIQYGSFVLTSLSPNGIFLSQAIGKSYVEERDTLVRAYDDYLNVNGTPFVLKDGNVLYPAVGSGTVFKHSFYTENYIPNIEGNRLADFSNNLGIFSSKEEKAVIIDYQPIEGAMLFYVKGTVGYRIKDEKDIIQTADGLFLHLKEGIFLADSNSRVLLSQEINDIIRDYYSSGSIYYNAYDKELYYVSDAGVFVYYFDMRSWSQIDLPRLKPGLIVAVGVGTEAPVSEPEKILNVYDDFEGNIYFLTVKGKYKLINTNATAYIKSHFYGAEALTFMKKINHLTFDYQGEIKYNNKRISSEIRKQKEIHRRLEERVPKRLEEFEFEFKGKVFNLEANFDIFPAIEK